MDDMEFGERNSDDESDALDSSDERDVGELADGGYEPENTTVHVVTVLLSAYAYRSVILNPA